MFKNENLLFVVVLCACFGCIQGIASFSIKDRTERLEGANILLLETNATLLATNTIMAQRLTLLDNAWRLRVFNKTNNETAGFLIMLDVNGVPQTNAPAQ